MGNILLEKNATEDFEYWGKADIKMLKKIAELFLSISKDSSTEIGKPEALTGDLEGYRSRRINEEHRIVYTIRPGEIIIISCRSHYKF